MISLVGDDEGGDEGGDEGDDEVDGKGGDEGPVTESFEVVSPFQHQSQPDVNCHHQHQNQSSI